MSQEIKVDKRIKFSADAQHNPNVEGDFNPKRVCVIDYFDRKALDTTFDYTVTVGGTSDAVAVSAGGVPGITMTTGTGDNEICFIATGLCYDISYKPAAETRMNIADVSGTTAFFGFASAVKDTTPEAIIDADTATINAGSGITDAVGFVIDADLGSSSIYFASINTSGAEQSVDTGLDWTDGVSHTLRVEIDTLGNAWGYVDGTAEAYIALAVADVPLCVVADAGTRANDGSNYVYHRYWKRWQDVP